MAYSRDVQDLFDIVNMAHKSLPKKQVNFLKLWSDSFYKNMEHGFYNIAYENLAMHELLLFKNSKKGDEFRLLLWRMFVMDFRRAFSDYEYRLLHR